MIWLNESNWLKCFEGNVQWICRLWSFSHGFKGYKNVWFFILMAIIIIEYNIFWVDQYHNLNYLIKNKITLKNVKVKISIKLNKLSVWKNYISFFKFWE